MKQKRLEEARKLYQTANADQKYVLESLFPELKESEGEQHRKWILEYLYDGLRKSDEQFKGQFKSAIAWLEKQGEQKPWSEEVQEEQVSEEFINALGTMLNDGLPDRYLVSEERIKKSAELLFSIARKSLKNEMQELSEEDKDMLKSIIATCELAEQDRDSSPARHLFEMQANWLKSLKERYTWKPSDEQMEALYKSDDMVLVELYQDLKKLRKE